MVKYGIACMLLLSWACANRVQPTGGPQDEDPPIAVFSTPLPGERNYNTQEVIIEFSEFIVTNGLREQLLITPRITGDYDFKIKKRTLYLKFDEPFSDSTTYTLNFRDGIGDITENNLVQNFLLAFSTGNLLDTLEIKGIIVDLLTKEPIEGATVGLYTIEDTLDIFTGPPYYFTKSDEKGDFIFRNLKDGNYRLYTFDDINQNLTCQSDQEAYGFLPHYISLDTAFVTDTLNTLNLNIDTLEITRTRLTGQYFMVQANKYLIKAVLQSENDSTIIFKFTDDRKGLKIYNSFIIKDSLKVTATLQDSLGYIMQDSFYLAFAESRRKTDEFKVSFKEPTGSKVKKIILGEIRFDKPLTILQLDSISIKRDSLEQYFINEITTYEYDTFRNVLKYSIEIPAALLDSLNTKKVGILASRGRNLGRTPSTTSYAVNIPAGSFISIENDSSKVLHKEIKFVESTNTGLISGNISTSHTSFFIQLLDDKYNIVKEHTNGTSYSFKEIKPGKYYIRIMIDENENGKWDPGDIRINKLPEQVVIYQDDNGNKITAIRANWELSIDLSF